MPLLVAGQVADPGAAFTQVVVTQAFGTALLLLPMTLALGAAFPLALGTAGPLRASGAQAGEGGDSTVARDAARVYTANTIGAIAGGGKGAAIGAAAGGGAGTGAVLATRGKETGFASGSTLNVKLTQPVKVNLS
jgi:hypothetical protein